MKANIVCDEVARIRDGQVVYRGKFGRYGALEGLVDEGLVSDYTADADVFGYKFTVVGNEASYQLRVRGRYKESVDGGPVKVFSFFATSPG